MVPNLTVYIKKVTNGVPHEFVCYFVTHIFNFNKYPSGVKNIFTTEASLEELQVTVFFFIMEVRGSNLQLEICYFQFFQVSTPVTQIKQSHLHSKLL